MKKTPKKATSFPVEKAEFYRQFEPWMKAKRSEGVSVRGVYKLVAGHAVPRVLKEDPNGILYIGRGDIKSRVGAFINSLNGTETGRHSGDRYIRLYPEQFPLPSLRIQIELTNDDTERESEYLAAYREEFGEYPPLNSQG